MLKKKVLEKIETLVNEGDEILSNYWAGINNHSFMIESHKVNYLAYRVNCLAFIELIGGKETAYFKEYEKETGLYDGYQIDFGIKILKRIKVAIDEGWFSDIRGLISAEIFSNLTEMAEYLLSENYKDPAAVIVGSVLEVHLKELCLSNFIDIEKEDKKGKLRPKKADTLNAELYKGGVYNKLEQKSITAWLDLRNKAAHGLYTEYTKEQVVSLLKSVNEFIVRNPAN